MKRHEAQAIVSAFVKMRSIATDEQALSVPALYPTWREGMSYAEGDRVLFDGVLFKALQAHDSLAEWTPVAAPSLFAKVLVPDASVIPEWEQPDSTNGYSEGEKVAHNGATWVSLVNDNVWEPTDAVPTLWKRIDD